MRYNVTRDEAVQRIANRAEFQVRSGSLSGREQNPGPVHYYATAYHTRREQNILANVTTCDYTVFSYSTPIAWHDADGWHVFDRSFTPTTNARHLPVVREAIGARWHYDYHTRELVQDSPALYVAESFNASVTPRQGAVLATLQAIAQRDGRRTFAYGRSDAETRRELRIVSRLADRGYVTANPDGSFELTDIGMRAHV
jgi:hypothetical protein